MAITGTVCLRRARDSRCAARGRNAAIASQANRDDERPLYDASGTREAITLKSHRIYGNDAGWRGGNRGSSGEARHLDGEPWKKFDGAGNGAVL